MFIVHFPIGLDFHFIIFFLHFFLSWKSLCRSQVLPCPLLHSLTMSLLVVQPVFCLQLYTPYISSPSPHQMSIPFQPTSNDSSDAQLKPTFSILHSSSSRMETTHIHLIICISALSNFNPTLASKGLVSLP